MIELLETVLGDTNRTYTARARLNKSQNVVEYLIRLLSRVVVYEIYIQEILRR